MYQGRNGFLILMAGAAMWAGLVYSVVLAFPG